MEMLSRLGEAWLMIIIGLVVLWQKNFRNVYFFAAAVLCTVIPSLFTQLLKYNIGAPRPMTVYANQPWVHHLDHWALLHNNAFPSGHTTGAFSFFCFLAALLPAQKQAWGLLLFFIALGTAYARVYLAAHFFADIYAGSIIGTVLSFFISKIIYSYQDKRQGPAANS